MSSLPEQADDPNKLFPKARAFFVGPIDQTNCDGRLALVLRVDAPQNFDAGQHVQTAIEPAAVRHGIDVAADEQRFVGFAAQGRPKISGRVIVNFQPPISSTLPAQPFSRLRPG